MRLLSRKFWLWSAVVSTASILFMMLFLPTPAAAQNNTAAQNTSGYDDTGAVGLVQCGNKTNDPCTVEDIFNVFIIATNLMIGLVGLFTIYAIFQAGFTMTTSAGSAERLRTGKKQLVNAVIGMLLVMLAFLLVNVIVYVLIGAKGGPNILTDPLEYIGLTGPGPSSNDPPPAAPNNNVPANK